MHNSEITFYQKLNSITNQLDKWLYTANFNFCDLNSIIVDREYLGQRQSKKRVQLHVLLSASSV